VTLFEWGAVALVAWFVFGTAWSIYWDKR